MEGNVVKVVFEDDGRTKVLRGRILKEDEFTYTLEAIDTCQQIVLGKRSVVKISDVGGGLI